MCLGKIITDRVSVVCETRKCPLNALQKNLIKTNLIWALHHVKLSGFEKTEGALNIDNLDAVRNYDFRPGNVTRTR